MNQPWQYQKPKNWQWRVILWSSLFLIFGKNLGQWAYHAFAIDQAYTATANIANKVGMTEVLSVNNELSPTQLIIDVRNDTPSEYTIESKISTGQLNFYGQVFPAGNLKRFTVRAGANGKTGNGDILFLSSPMAGSHNTICQEIHTLSYDLKYAKEFKQPLVVNLSSIASKMDCKNNAAGFSE